MLPGSCEECFDPDAPAFSLTRSHLPTSLSLMLYHTNTHDEDDADSACEVEPLTGDETQTLPTSITDYRYEFGRRYHSFYDGAYWGPNDYIANRQQDLTHHMYRVTLDGKLHLAPVENPQNILDVGTGTGIWAIEMADKYPSARVIGVDLSPIQPPFVPPNCIFEIDNVTLPWTYASDQFEFIHVRELYGSIPDWDEFFRQCWRCLKPGGYIEVTEHSAQPISDDGTVGPDHFYRLWGQMVADAGNRSGKSFAIWEESATRLKRSGFIDIVERHYKWPVNRWSKDPILHEIGRWNHVLLHEGIEGLMLRRLTSTLQWSYERAQVFLAQMRACLQDCGTHAYLPVTVVYAQKPPYSSILRGR